MRYQVLRTVKTDFDNVTKVEVVFQEIDENGEIGEYTYKGHLQDMKANMLMVYIFECTKNDRVLNLAATGKTIEEVVQELRGLVEV